MLESKQTTFIYHRTTKDSKGDSMHIKKWIFLYKDNNKWKKVAL